MEPMARKMLAEDPALKAAFDKRLREDKASPPIRRRACNGSTSARRSTT